MVELVRSGYAIPLGHDPLLVRLFQEQAKVLLYVVQEDIVAT